MTEDQNAPQELAAPAAAPLARPAAAPLSPAAAYLLRCNSASRATMRYSLEAVVRAVRDLPPATPVDAEAFPWHELRADHVAAIRARLEERCRPATANRHLAALRGVLEVMFDARLLSADELLRAQRAARSVRADDSEPAGRMLSPAEVQRLYEASNCSRDRALLALAVHSGLRRDELSRLDLEDVDRTTGELSIVGKGKKRRSVFLGARPREALALWLDERGAAPGALFWRRDAGGAYQAGRRLSRSGVWTAICTVAERAEIEATPHDFRRTFASTLLDAGEDLATVQKLMGHSDPGTTSRYDRRGDVAKKRAAEKLDKVF